MTNDLLTCEVHGSCRQPVALKVDGKYMCDVHWKKRCDDDEQAACDAQIAKHADDPVHHDYLTQTIGAPR